MSKEARGTFTGTFTVEESKSDAENVNVIVEPEVIADAEPEVIANAEPEDNADAEPEVIANAEPEDNADAEPEVNAEDDADADADAEPEVNAEDDADADADAEPEVNAEDNADADANAEPDVNANAEVNPEADGLDAWINRGVDADGGDGGDDETPEEDDVAQPWYSNRGVIAGGIGLLALLLIIGLAMMSGNKDTAVAEVTKVETPAEVPTADTTVNSPFNLALAPVPDCQYRGVVIRSSGSEVFRAKGGFVGNGCPAVIGAPKFLQDDREKTLLHAHPSNDGTLYVSFTNGIDWNDTQSTQQVAVYTGK